MVGSLLASATGVSPDHPIGSFVSPGVLTAEFGIAALWAVAVFVA